MMRRDRMASDKLELESKLILPEQSMMLRKTWLGHRKTYAGLRFGSYSTVILRRSRERWVA